MDKQKIEEASQLLRKLLGSDLVELINGFSIEPGQKGSFFIEIPTPETMDLSAEELGSLVARTSNNYNRVLWLAGRANAAFKQAEAAYKYRYKVSLNSGKNVAERESNAMEAAKEELKVLSLVEACVELGEAATAAARVSSESARKLFDKVNNMNIASNREAKGQFKESDFDSW